MAKKFSHDVVNNLLGSGNTTEILKNKQTESRNIDEPKKRGRKKTNFNSEQEIKITFTVYKAQIETIRALAYWDRATIKEFIIHLIDTYLEFRTKDINKAVELYKKKYGEKLSSYNIGDE